MKKLKLEIEYELSIMDNYNLTAEEWMFIQLVFLAQEEEGHPELLKKYIEIDTEKTSILTLLSSLQDKQIINKSYKLPKKGDTFNADKIEFNKNFLNQVLKNSGDLGYELFYAYPKFTYINGTPFSLLNISKHFKTQADFFYAYGKSIRFNPETHKKVISILEEAKEQNLINYNICEFIISNKWYELEDILNTGLGASNIMEA